MSCLQWMLAVAVLTAASPGLIVAQTLQCPRNEALKKADLLTLVANQVAERRVVQFLDTCGVQFEVSAETEEDLRAVGAQTSVIEALRAAGDRYTRAMADTKRARDEAEAARVRAEETEAWARIGPSGGVTDIENFLRKFPGGLYSSAAQARLAELRTAAATFAFGLKHYHRSWLGTFSSEPNVPDMVIGCAGDGKITKAGFSFAGDEHNYSWRKERIERFDPKCAKNFGGSDVLCVKLFGDRTTYRFLANVDAGALTRAVQERWGDPPW